MPLPTAINSAYQRAPRYQISRRTLFEAQAADPAATPVPTSSRGHLFHTNWCPVTVHFCAVLFRSLRSPVYPVRTVPPPVGRFTIPPPCFKSAVWCECGFKFHHWLVRNACAPADRMVCGRTPTKFSKVSSRSVSPMRAFGRHSWHMGTTAKHSSAVDRVLELWSWPSCSQEKRDVASTKSPSDPLSRRLPSIRLLLLRMYFQYHSTLLPKNGAYECDGISKVRYEAWGSNAEK